MLELIQPTKQAITRRGDDLANHPAAAYLAGLSEGARRPQRNALNSIANILTSGAVSDCLAVDWGAVRYSHAAAVRSRLAEVYKPATANRMLAAFRGVMHAARFLKLIDVEEWQSITAPKIGALKTVTGETLPAGRELGGGELVALVEDCQADKNRSAGIRDAAVIAVMYAGGLRRAEVVNLDLAHFDPTENKLTFTGKRNKQRTAYIQNGAAAAMADWLQIRGGDEGPLFLAINKSDRVRAAGRMTSQAVYNMLQRRAQAAGIAHFSPHDLRRTFVSDLLEAGADIATVAKMAGHSNVQTTSRYDRRPEQAKARAAGLLHMPYKSKVR